MNSKENTELLFRMDEELIEAFVCFSGDRSSLHTDPVYGRRSRYNSTVVHGMLPVVLLPLLLHRLFSGRSVQIKRAQARFIKPIMPGTEAKIVCTVEEIEGGDKRVFFSVITGREGTPATTGNLLLELVPPINLFLPDTGTNDVIPRELDEQETLFEDLEKGRTCELPFEWGPGQLRAYLNLLKIADRERSPHAGEEILNTNNAAIFGQLAALSTLVGMVMPGRSATFQEFILEGNVPLSEAPVTGRLTSELTHRSAPTSTITQHVEFHASGKISTKGKLSVRVAHAPFSPLTMEALLQKSRGKDLEQKVVLITGSSRGLGATTAKLFALHGARVVINFRSSVDRARDLVSEIMDFGGEALAVCADVTSAVEVERMVKKVMSHWGTIDILVNNAAGNFHTAPFRETPWSKVQEDLDVVVKGAFLTSQAVIPEFLRRGSGNIINISSIAADTPPIDQVKYVVAKSALNGLSRSLAVEFAEHNIRVNLVVPSFMKTDFTNRFDRVAIGKLQATSPMKRLAEPHEIAETILFLASHRSSYITGQKIMVTGGLPPYH